MDEKYWFCSASLDLEEYNKFDPYCLQYNEGLVGEINNFQVIITKDETVVENELDRIRKEFDQPQPKSERVRLTVDLSYQVHRLTTERMNDCVYHCWRSAQYVTIHSGLGYFGVEKPEHDMKLSENKFIIEFDVVDKNAFQKLYEEFLAPSGILAEQIKVEVAE